MKGLKYESAQCKKVQETLGGRERNEVRVLCRCEITKEILDSVEDFGLYP